MLENAFVAVVSADMRWIAWTTRTPDGADLSVASWPGLTGARQIASGVPYMFWAPNGSELLNTDQQEKLYSVRIDPPSPPREIPSTGSPHGFSPDGTRFLTVAVPTELPTSTIRMIQNWQAKP